MLELILAGLTLFVRCSFIMGYRSTEANFLERGLTELRADRRIVADAQACLDF
jgi:hypothetical protein